MNQLQQVFNYGIKEVRTVFVDNELWFVAKDACDVLELTNPSKAISTIDDDEKTTLTISYSDNLTTNVLAVNEGGLYSLIFKSRKPEAKVFKRWITHEVIPTIRKTGQYGVFQTLPRNLPEALRMLADAEEEKERLALTVAAQIPKVEMYETLMHGEGTQSMLEVAKSFGYGRNILFKLLREIGVLMDNNLPYQSLMDNGYFEVVEKTKVTGSGIYVFPTTRVTPKGIDYIGRKLRENGKLRVTV